MLLLCVCIYFTMMPQIRVYADLQSTKDKLDKAKAQHEQTKDKIDDTKDNISDLKDERNTLQGELNKLNDQLEEVSEDLAELEQKIADKEDQIQQTLEDLEKAKQTEANQYEAMKKRICFMYEKQDYVITEIIFASKGMGDFLNKTNYIEQLSAYDRKMLTQYKETRQSIEDTEARLEEEKEELNEYHEEVVEKQKQVQSFVNNTSSSIKTYTGQIKDAEAVCAAYEAQSAQEEADIAALKKQYEEELALSRLAAKSKWRDISEVSFEEGDRMLLANLIYCEAGNQPYEGQLAVGAVVINRVLSSVYPNTVVGVIYQNKQFSPVGSGRLALALSQDLATPACYKAADEAMSGQTPVGNCVYFRTPIEGLQGIQIGGHIFY